MSGTNYGLGGIYRVKGSSRWWIRFSRHGVQHRESSGSTSESKARALLKQRLGEIAANKFAPRADKVTLGDLLNGLENHYRVNNRRSTPSMLCRCAHLVSALGRDFPAVNVSTPRLRAYMSDRLAAGAAPASIGLEISHLRTAFNLAIRDGVLNVKPFMPTLTIHNVREGFLLPGDASRLFAALPDDVADLIEFLYLSAWRSGEGKSLQWSRVDLRAKQVTLDPARSKNGRGRLLPLGGDLLRLFERRLAKRRLDCPYVFHREGAPIRDFRGAWIRATAAAGLTGLLVHDLRRSGIRNLVRAGVTQHVAMQMSGHQTAHVFRRYDIVDDQDLQEAAGKLDAYLQSQQRVTKVVPLISSITLAQSKC